MRKNAAQQSRVVMVEVTSDTSRFHKRQTSFYLRRTTARCYLLCVNRNTFCVIARHGSQSPRPISEQRSAYSSAPRSFPDLSFRQGQAALLCVEKFGAGIAYEA